MILATGAEPLPLLTTLAAAFAAAWILGILTQRLGLSPIVGYLLAGVVIGPHTPGFVGDVALAQQLAEIGVILLMFAVGLHFRLQDLVAVKGVAVPGAIGQSLVATLMTWLVFHLLDWPAAAALVLGMAMAVASTVVLLRVLLDQHMLNTSHGHVAVGWLIVEDIMTVFVLVLIPVISEGMIAPPETASAGHGLAAIGWAMGRLCVLIAIVLLAGSRLVPWILTRVALLRSSELFTLTVLVLSITIAVASATFFGASLALGAFLAGMVVAQSPASHQAAADALPMRDAFAVIFFVSIGMLFDPSFLIEHPISVLAGVGIVLIVKPIAAMLIVSLRGYPVRTSLTVAIGLAQIGEFSFILAQVANAHGLFPATGLNIVVATAMITISLNPLLFRSLPAIERALERRPHIWRLLNDRHERRSATLNAATHESIASVDQPLAVIVGYGPVGHVVDALLRDAHIETVIVDLNMDTIRKLSDSKRLAVYGDANRREVLHHAGVDRAIHVVITLPHSEGRVELVRLIRELNPSATITVRARYLAEREGLIQAGASHVVMEEGEAGIALSRRVLLQRGLSGDQVEELLTAIRSMWQLNA